MLRAMLRRGHSMQYRAQYCVQSIITGVDTRWIARNKQAISQATITLCSRFAQLFMQCRDKTNWNWPIRAPVYFCLQWLGNRTIKHDLLLACNVAACVHATEKPRAMSRRVSEPLVWIVEHEEDNWQLECSHCCEFQHSRRMLHHDAIRGWCLADFGPLGCVFFSLGKEQLKRRKVYYFVGVEEMSLSHTSSRYETKIAIKKSKRNVNECGINSCVFVCVLTTICNQSTALSLA